MGGLIAHRQRHQVLAQCHASYAKGVQVAPTAHGRRHRCHLHTVRYAPAHGAQGVLPRGLGGPGQCPAPEHQDAGVPGGQQGLS